MNRFTPKGYVPTETAKEMTIQDIRKTIEEHVRAARWAMEAGFDGVEIVSFPFLSASRHHTSHPYSETLQFDMGFEWKSRLPRGP